VNLKLYSFYIPKVCCVFQESDDVLDSTGQQSDGSPESVSTTAMSSTSKSQNGEVQMWASVIVTE